MTLKQFKKIITEAIGNEQFEVFDSEMDKDFSELAKMNVKDITTSLVFSGENENEIFCVTITKIKY